MLAELTKYAIWGASPLGLWVILTLVAFTLCVRRPNTRMVLCVWAQLQLLAFSTPRVADHLFSQLEQEAAQLQAGKPLHGPVKAIVVLGGGVDGAYAGLREQGDLNNSGDRVLEGARLYRNGVSARVVVSGGKFGGDPNKGTEAAAMQSILQDLGVPPHNVLMDEQSRTTLENARYTRDLLGPGQHSIALVTSAYHLPRAVRLFEQAGFDVYPVRCDIRVVPEQTQFWEELPRYESLERSTLAIKEWLGRLQLHVSSWY
ncbi:YdcF family protein [Limnobacter humi]|uniref:YdcF family protein n=1 Tax=Limnobacter humi TaxID=1778671 RepID=A0ABT1WDT3_9BURK|nr:YdcF family protein [Limnobacter humi]MCQ8895682.1 YdcF family protein [Limnobacter humi]